MYAHGNATRAATITQPLALCVVGVVGFSFTLPATRMAGGELHPLLIGPGRGALAGLFAAAILLARRERLPARSELAQLALVALGVVIGFPVCTSYALQWVPAQHAVVVAGLLPLATAVIAALRNGERPSRAFWLWALAGAAAVLTFSGTTTLAPADALLLLAVALCALGYAEGGRLARTRDGLSVTCWALVLALPLTSVAALSHLPERMPSLVAWASFAWVSLISALFAFAAWYRGLATGGVARGSQVQLLQPLLSLAWCALLLGEAITVGTVIAGAAVLVSAVGARRART
jgi:drug/metabolite transporter (DMT)-like permease